MVQEKQPRKTILIVEDDIAIGSLILQIATEEIGFPALHIRDSLQVLDIVKKVVPALFILNYQLPHMNGIELYDTLYTRGYLENVPVLMISANLPKQELEKRRIRGLDKPFDVDCLVQAITTLLAASSGNSLSE